MKDSGLSSAKIARWSQVAGILEELFTVATENEACYMIAGLTVDLEVNGTVVAISLTPDRRAAVRKAEPVLETAPETTSLSELLETLPPADARVESDPFVEMKRRWAENR